MHPIKAPIYQTAQIREFERMAVERFHVTPDVMMQRAGKAAFDFLQRRWPQAQNIAIFCGSGNNGVDGYVLAQLVQERGMKVTIWQVGEPNPEKKEAYEAFTGCQQANISINTFTDKVDLEHPDVIVDAICGIGAHEAMRDNVVSAIKRMQKKQVPILSIDIPTGIDADTGNTLGAAVQASATITFIGLKLGLMTGDGIAYTGELVLNDLQFPTELYSYIAPIAERVTVNTYATYLKPRRRDWHKGLSGHVLVIGGELGFSGAPRMAASAALRVGAGLVTVATRVEHSALINENFPEIMCLGVNEPHELDKLLTRANVVVFGPGLGQSDWSKALFQYIGKTELPIVLDADGLNLLAGTDKTNENWVLTPHPGEAARLLGVSVQSIQEDRLSAIKSISKRYGGVCVLKGAGSLILAPNALPALCDKGNPGMASAGMGDVLSGVIAGLMAQGVPLSDAAKLGVCMHAIAGDLAAKDGERGMVATDLLVHLRRISNHHV
jgi:NAD(P)H-hydrate epimerase